MRKFLFLVLGAIIAFASCQKDDLLGGENGKEIAISLSTKIPTSGVQGRATGEATSVNRYIMEVYTGGELYKRMVQKTTTFDLRLVTGQTYDFLFWADNGTGTDGLGDNHYFTTSLKTISMQGDYKGNDETRDAFFGNLTSQTITLAYTPEAVDLKRPFGQLNVATTDLSEIGLDKLKPDAVSVVFNTKLYTIFNVLDGSVAGEASIQYVAPANTIGANGALSVDYLFAPTMPQRLPVDFTMTFLNSGKEITTNSNFKAVPIQRNYQTNVSGKLLTKQGTITVEVKPTFDGTLAHDIIEVTDVAGVNAQLQSTAANDGQPLAVSVTEKVGENAEVQVPAAVTATNTPVISMSFPAGVETSKTLTVTDQGIGSDPYTGEVHISIPTSAGAILSINMPGATVYLNGAQVDNVTASTSLNTFVVSKDSKIGGTLTVNKGNVDVYGEVNRIVKGEGNSENTIVNIFPGGKVASTGEGITVKEIVPGIKNITTGKSYATLQDAVDDAKTNETIELSEGRYPIFYKAPSADDAFTYYLLIGNGIYSNSVKKDQDGLSIVGIGHVTLYAGDENNTGMVNGQDLILVNANRVTLKNLRIEANYNEYFKGPNKTVEVYEASDGFVMDGCEIIPNSKDPNDGGSVYVGSYQTPGITAIKATIKNCKFNHVGISVRSNATVDVINNTFNYVREEEGWNTCLSVRGSANVKGNTFTNVQPVTDLQNSVNVLGDGVVKMSENVFPTSANYCAGVTNSTKGTMHETIAKAMTAASNGEVIVVPAGSNEESVTVKAGVTLAGEGSASVLKGYLILENGATIKNFKHDWACPASPRTAIYVRGSNVTMDGVEMVGKKKKADNSNAEGVVTETGASNLTVKNCKFSGYWKDFYLNTCKGLLFKNNEFFDGSPFSTDLFDPSMVLTGNKFPAAAPSSWGTKLCHLVVSGEFASGKEISEWSTELKAFLNGMYENNTWDGASGIRITTDGGDVYVDGKID